MVNYYRANGILGPGWLMDMRRIAEREPLDTPTLMIWGEVDSALGKELTYGTECAVTDFTLRYLPNVSHWVQQEAPEAVNGIMKAWLTGKPVLGSSIQ